MASFFNLTLDTLAPSGLSVSLNSGATTCTSRTVTLSVSVSDSDTTGYQIKIWGIDGVASEDAASWETFTGSKSITLTDGDGLKTVYVKVRDDVGNETAAVSDSITLNTSVPVVTVVGPDRSKISKVSGYNSAVISFTVDVDFDAYKVCVVPATNSLQDAGVVIPSTNGSVNTSGSAGGYPASTAINVTIKGADLEAASAGDGVKIVKVFVRNTAGTWSVA